ncbi:MAG: recombinase family protein [Comamonadaceae bacterium]|nr:recombinase family protein [Comamonadaceae bacterium]
MNHPLKVARIYQRVSTEAQDLTRQAALVKSTRAAGFYIAGVYQEKASGARADWPELLRLIADAGGGDQGEGRPAGGSGVGRPVRAGCQRGRRDEDRPRGRAGDAAAPRAAAGP